jgi:hypothetical protein
MFIRHHLFTRRSRLSLSVLLSMLLGLLPLASVHAQTISGFTPTSGGVGTKVTITGTNFVTSGMGMTVFLVKGVTFNGVTAQFTVGNATTLTATVPAGATTGPIRLAKADGGVVTSATNFTVLPSPTISSFTPTSGGVGTVATIYGTNFTGATGVTFNGAAASFTVLDVYRINATVPAGATTGPIKVTTPGGTATSATNFTVLPTISSFSPASAAIGTAVTLTGKNFTGATKVLFYPGVAAQFTVGNSTTITATVPAGATTGSIQVTTPGGTATSSAKLTVFPPPRITGITPLAGGVGTVVTLTGEHFTGATKVTFNEVAANYVVLDAYRIKVYVPAGATNGPIKVATPGGTATSGTTNFIVN